MQVGVGCCWGYVDCMTRSACGQGGRGSRDKSEGVEIGSIGETAGTKINWKGVEGERGRGRWRGCGAKGPDRAPPPHERRASFATWSINYIKYTLQSSAWSDRYYMCLSSMSTYRVLSKRVECAPPETGSTSLFLSANSLLTLYYSRSSHEKQLQTIYFKNCYPPHSVKMSKFNP